MPFARKPSSGSSSPASSAKPSAGWASKSIGAIGRWLHRHWLAAAILPAAAALSFIAVSQTTPSTFKTVDLASEPLYAVGTSQKPTLSLALSVEFPTVGAQYTNGGSVDDTYLPTNEYIGYFDADSCYVYNNHTNPDYRRFDRSGVATDHACNGAGFSGNYLNWASSSAIDVLRLGLTGGDRIVDEANLTVLQRAVLDRSNGSFYNGNNFPAKRLRAAYVAGALPTALVGTWTGDVVASNCLNRIHFGTSIEGNCDNPANNANLGVTVGSTQQMGTVTSSILPPLIGFSRCAGENEVCTFSGVRRVAYGTLTSWRYVSASNGINCSNAVFGDPLGGVVKACYIGPDNTGWTPVGATANGSTVLSSDRFFYTRVQVCESSGGTLQDPRTNFCLKYPNNNYKPTGNLQKYSDRLRVAAFGYLMDSRVERYGGVLRAPMKYVGPKNYDDTGTLQTASNPKVEWDLNTGVFTVNPESATAEGKSGVINYLNQFGRTGTTIGNYKVYDPVSELYYEALRYVQGLPPTPDATSGMTDAMKDGFPVYTSWTDPHAGGSRTRDYSCLRNNIVVIGDVNTHYDKYIPGNTSNTDGYDGARAANLAGNEPNFYDWTRVVGSFEANATTSYIDDDGISRNTSNPNGSGTNAPRNFGNLAAAQFSDKAGFFMAGMAYWANTHDIRGTGWTDAPAKQRPGMKVKTYILDVNEYGDNNNRNTRHGTPFFLAGKYGGFNDLSGVGNPYLSTAGTLDNSSWEAEGNPGEPRNYFLSSSARSVLTALDNMFAAIASQGGSIGGGAISTQQLTSAGSYIYQAQFDPTSWSGDLISYPVSVGANNVVTVGTAATKQWSAAAQLDAMLVSSRNIVVGNVTRTNGAASNFTWATIEGGGNGTLKNQLRRASPTASADADSVGEARLNFIRGDRSLEGSTFRKRNSRLGDIVNSGVALGGAPNAQITDAGYNNFYNTNKDRTRALYVGANDGMLHAFNADTGSELFAYIPSWMGPRLSMLASPTYNSSLHQSYVDATPAVAEAYVGSAWKTVLVGGTGAGGQGVFALDVTDPTAFNKDKVMWEFTDADDPDMGNVIGRPQILKFRTSGPTAPVATYKYFAVVASGVNNTAADGRASTSGNPAIFLLDLSKAGNTPWSPNNNYFKISLPVNATTATAFAPGVAEFSATGGPVGEVAAIYAGDLHGNVWKMDFTKVASTSWNMSSLSAFKSGSTPVPFFIAKDSTGVVQPITMAPTLVFGPDDSKIVSFGTGKYLETSDNVVAATTQRQSLYTLYDNQSPTLDTSTAGSSVISGRGRLALGSVNAANRTITVPNFSYGRPMTDGDTTQRSGWYVDFPNAAERQVSNASVFGDSIIFGTLQPPAATSNACAGGSGYQYQVKIGSGNGQFVASTVGVLGQPFVLQVGAATFTDSDSAGRRTTTTTGQIILQGSTGISSQSTSQVAFDSVTGRLSWRRINNYQQLKRATP
ncbi:Pilus assembly protein PilY [Burkholderiales bacterium 8X]|nr:Pilus assembly protein PilY [Burkholderiales bacterium 8X]